VTKLTLPLPRYAAPVHASRYGVTACEARVDIDDVARLERCYALAVARAEAVEDALDRLRLIAHWELGHYEWFQTWRTARAAHLKAEGGGG
jgi:hypothetical protein